MHKEVVKRKKSSVYISIIFLALVVLINMGINFIDLKAFRTVTEFLLLGLDGFAIYVFLRYRIYKFIYIINDEGVEIRRTMGEKDDRIVFVPFENIKYLGEKDKKPFGKIKRKLNCGQSFSTSKMKVMVFENSYGDLDMLYFEPSEKFISLINK